MWSYKDAKKVPNFYTPTQKPLSFQGRVASHHLSGEAGGFASKTTENVIPPAPTVPFMFLFFVSLTLPEF